MARLQEEQVGDHVAPIRHFAQVVGRHVTGPEPGGLGRAGSGRQHADGCVVGKDRLGRPDMATDGKSQRLQQAQCTSRAQCRLILPILPVAVSQFVPPCGPDCLRPAPRL